jgi:hypothetical protein
MPTRACRKKSASFNRPTSTNLLADGPEELFGTYQATIIYTKGCDPPSSLNRAIVSEGHWANRVKPRIVTTKTPEPRIRRKGLTPRSSSSAAQMIKVTSATARITVSILPCGWRKCRAIDEIMKTDNDILGHWATVMRPVRRLRNAQRNDRETHLGIFGGVAVSADVTYQPCLIQSRKAPRTHL